jgi:tetratricopeptide (TPR) repeat protein
MAFSSRGSAARASCAERLEKEMRALPKLLMIGVTGLVLAAPVAGQRSDDQINPRSVVLMHQGEAFMSLGKYEQAEDALETALAVDPRNRWAFVDLARVAEKQHLFGKAIRMTNKALLIEPNDVDAIAVQGEAMVELGAIARAQANLQKLQGICRQGCPQVAQLSGAITRGPSVASAKAPDVPKKN